MALINMVDVDFGPLMPRLHPITIHRFLKSLGVSEVLGVSPLLQNANQVARITFKSEAETESFLNQHGGMSHHDLEGQRVQVVVKDPGVQEKFIRIADFPVNVNLDIVKTRLREFGTVLNIRRERYKATEEHDYIECFNGFITARMTLTQAIPSYLMIGDYKVYVRYNGQMLTCRVCNQAGHLGAQCPKKKLPTMPMATPPIEKEKGRKEKEKQKTDYNVDFPPLPTGPNTGRVSEGEKNKTKEKKKTEDGRVDMTEEQKHSSEDSGKKKKATQSKVDETTQKEKQNLEKEMDADREAHVKENREENEKDPDESLDKWLTLSSQDKARKDPKQGSVAASVSDEATDDESEKMSDVEGEFVSNEHFAAPSHTAIKRTQRSPTPGAKRGKKQKGKSSKN